MGYIYSFIGKFFLVHRPNLHIAAEFCCQIVCWVYLYFHHQIVFAKFKSMISYPPPYLGLGLLLQLSAVSYYHKALHLGCCISPRSASDTDLIRGVIFNWKKVCYNTILRYSIYFQYISIETLSCLPCFNSRIKSLSQHKNKLYKDCRRTGLNAQLLNYTISRNS